MSEIIVIAHNIRSTHNVGSIFRTCEGFGVVQLILSGYTPYPTIEKDSRLPHIRDKLSTQIHKTALDAENLVPFVYQEMPDITRLRADGYTIVGLEQDMRSIPLSSYIPSGKIALWLGEEVEGLTADQRDLCDVIIEIPMHGQKESFNVSVAAGIALYGLCYPPK
jgi:tRNA G18 (ribose-2'-O)-methylase SpoU